MARHLFLPKQSIKDIRALLRLDEEKLRTLEQLFSTGESIAPSDPNFLQKVADQLRIDSDTASSVVLVTQFLLTVVEGGRLADEILDDVRYFVDQYDAEDKALVTNLDHRRLLLLSLLTPKAERARAQKIRYLQNIYPTAESFRTVCELRPVFDQAGGGERIVGYVPTILLEVKQADADGDESQTVLHLSAGALADLAKVLRRAEEKLSVIRGKFGDELLGDTSKE
jgi:hypothetical protein